MLRILSGSVRRSTVEFLAVRALSTRLDDAAKRLKTLQEEPENDVKLRIYALYKQATVGDVNIPKPGSFDFVGKVKWVAWKKIEGTPKEKAEDEYVELVESLLSSEQKSGATSSTMDSSVP
ncbi:acyl-CoA-binding protein homolog 1-like, partial [Galendromus occidentalis]|uniref:Acyl-CoA-binding protein homolog 1-like n=1 Tax=Galendromus occidentalis TaxID=34638 RepID=A0AAJ6VX88_9ACAR